jgi:Uma2 family endonuclease
MADVTLWFSTMSSAFTPVRTRLTVTQFQRMGETGILPPDARIELIDGEMLEMAPIGPAHMHLVNRLTRLLVRAVGDAAIVSVQNPVVVDPYSEPQPDLVLIRPEAEAAGRLPESADVLLLIEVSDSTLRFDRKVKLPLYARRGIAEAWIVNVAGRTVEVHRDPHAEGYRLHQVVGIEQTLAPAALPSAALRLRDIFGS